MTIFTPRNNPLPTRPYDTTLSKKLWDSVDPTNKKILRGKMPGLSKDDFCWAGGSCYISEAIASGYQLTADIGRPVLMDLNNRLYCLTCGELEPSSSIVPTAIKERPEDPIIEELREAAKTDPLYKFQIMNSLTRVQQAVFPTQYIWVDEVSPSNDLFFRIFGADGFKEVLPPDQVTPLFLLTKDRMQMLLQSRFFDAHMGKDTSVQ